MNDEAIILESQLRECYGRVVYTYKTQEKCADILLNRHKCINIWQISLSAIITGGILATLLEDWEVFATATSALLSTALLALNSYAKDYDLGGIAQKRRQAAADIWLIREKYLSLLTDLRSHAKPLDDIRAARDALPDDLHTTYKGAPSTDSKTYGEAQKALKKMEDMTFSDEEIDKFLPTDLKRSR